MNNWNIILKDFAYKCGKDGPDMTNSNHLALLRESLIKFGWKENTTNEFVGNLREGKEIVTEDWWSDLGTKGQAQYIKDHPKSKKAQEAEAEKDGEEESSKEGKVRKIETDPEELLKIEKENKSLVPTKSQQAHKTKLDKKIVDVLGGMIKNKNVIKLKGGASSNSATVEEAIALRDFTTARIAQDKEKAAAKDIIFSLQKKLDSGKELTPKEQTLMSKAQEKIDEEPHVHPDIVQREITDDMLAESVDVLEKGMTGVVNEETGETEYEVWVKRQSTGGAVDSFLTSLPEYTVYKNGNPPPAWTRDRDQGATGDDGKPIKVGTRVDLSKDSTGYTRVKELIRRHLKNDGRCVVTGKRSKFSEMEYDHRIPYSSAQNETMEELGLSTEDWNRLIGNKKKLSPKDLKLREKLDEIYRPKAVELDNPQTNGEFMVIGANQLKGSALNEGILNRVKNRLAQNPDLKSAKDDYVNERQRKLDEYYMKKFEDGDFSMINEKDINQMDLQETDALMKAYNYYHPSAKEFKEQQITGIPKKGIPPDPEYYDKLKEYWKGRGVDLPEDPKDIDFSKPPFNGWINRYEAPGKKRGRGGSNRRNTGNDRKTIISHMRSVGETVSTEAEIDKSDRVIDEGREEVREWANDQQTEIELIKLSDNSRSAIQHKNSEKKIKEMNGGKIPPDIQKKIDKTRIKK
jgi:hypothetical protein